MITIFAIPGTWEGAGCSGLELRPTAAKAAAPCLPPGDLVLEFVIAGIDFQRVTKIGGRRCGERGEGGGFPLTSWVKQSRGVYWNGTVFTVFTAFTAERKAARRRA
jgi:hypothetical protein